MTTLVEELEQIQAGVDAFNPDMRAAAYSLLEAQEAVFKRLPAILAALKRAEPAADVAGLVGTARQLRAFYAQDHGTSLHILAADQLDEAAAALTSLSAQLGEAREVLEDAVAGMTCRKDDDAHYCPNCDNTTYDARERARAFLARQDQGK